MPPLPFPIDPPGAPPVAGGVQSQLPLEHIPDVPSVQLQVPPDFGVPEEHVPDFVSQVPAL
jgi:hypothetical protein